MGKRSAEREQFLSDVLDASVSGGISYWASVMKYRWEDGEVFAKIIEDEGDVRHTITLDTVARGIRVLTTGENAGKVFSMSGAEYWKQFLAANRTNGEDGDYDADIADNIVQAGLFGEVVYG